MRTKILVNHNNIIFLYYSNYGEASGAVPV